MDFIPVKDLKAPAQLRRKLAKAGEVVVTSNGQPMAIMVPVENGEQMELVLLALRQARARVALTRIRQAARRAGADKLSSADIEAEIRAARVAHKR